jgi:hypothetical protein
VDFQPALRHAARQLFQPLRTSRPALGRPPPLWGVHKQAAPRQPGERGLRPPKGGRLPGEAPRGKTFVRNAHLWGVHKRAGFWRPDERGLHPLEGGRLLGEAADSPRGAFACNASLWAAGRLHEQGLHPLKKAVPPADDSRGGRPGKKFACNVKGGLHNRVFLWATQAWVPPARRAEAFRVRFEPGCRTRQPDGLLLSTTVLLKNAGSCSRPPRWGPLWGSSPFCSQPHQPTKHEKCQVV